MVLENYAGLHSFKNSLQCVECSLIISGRVLENLPQVRRRGEAALLPHPRAQRLPKEPGAEGRRYQVYGR